MSNAAMLKHVWECYNTIIKLCEINLHVKMKAKLRCYGMRECRQEIEVLHKAPKKPVRKPAA